MTDFQFLVFGGSSLEGCRGHVLMVPHQEWITFGGDFTMAKNLDFRGYARELG